MFIYVTSTRTLQIKFKDFSKLIEFLARLILYSNENHFEDSSNSIPQIKSDHKRKSFQRDTHVGTYARIYVPTWLLYNLMV